MPRRLKPLFSLTSEQALASTPDNLAFVSASAGTGKTQVLTARVMRLLLAGVEPSAILCLTFTKAGAAEMADRIHARLAYWVRLKPGDLGAELKALGEASTPETEERARRLFARVLDAPGGGLRIQTIHSFAQSLLAAFPAEAGIVPGFRPIEPREEALLARETLAAMLVAAEGRGGDRLIGDVQALSRRLGEQGAEAFLIASTHAADALDRLGPEELIGDKLRESLGLPAGDVEGAIATICENGVSETALRRIAAANAAWGTATGTAAAGTIEAWLAEPVVERARTLDAVGGGWCTKKGELRKFAARLG
ncbi:MAG: UvrD-helicase domain-containing protein, partial [Sphingomonadaceae bacterium]|nr:UvrD-helicase domain-containing protein [Sphingomonadaceae bacterium]